MTMVAGEVVVEDGRVLTVDEAALKAEARELALRCQGEFARTEAAARALEPFYREMYLRALKVDVGMERRAGPMTP